jgi:hypothetical protein
MEAVAWLTEAAESSIILADTLAATTAATAAAAAAAAAAPVGSWRRCFYLVDHLFDNKLTKREAKVTDLAYGTRVSAIMAWLRMRLDLVVCGWVN